ncbi:MAG: hypothetical protein U0Q16_25815 [Bryobacteraceae bacterium]
MRFVALFSLFAAAGTVAILGQEVEPPELSDPPGKLVAAASQKLEAWVQFKPGLMAEIFRADPATVLRDLEQAATLMRAYKKSERLAYRRLAKDVAQDIQSLQRYQNVDWKRFVGQRVTSVATALGAVAEQTAALEKERQRYERLGTPEARGYIALIDSQLQGLSRVRDDLSKQIGLMQMTANRDDVGQAQAEAIEAMRKQRDRFDAMQMQAEMSEASMESFYAKVIAAVKDYEKRNPRPTTASSAPQAGAPAGPAAVNQEPRTWTRRLRKNASITDPIEVHLKMLESDSGFVSGTLEVWVLDNKHAPDVSARFSGSKLPDEAMIRVSNRDQGAYDLSMQIKWNPPAGPLPRNIKVHSITWVYWKGGMNKEYKFRDLDLTLSEDAPPADKPQRK